MSECSCPVHNGIEPPTYPLGQPFKDKLTVEPISQHIAKAIYKAHHSYMPDIPSVNLTHHGVFIDGCLTGAITYRHPLISQLKNISGENIVEVARICIAVDMPNLASAGLKASQERFKRAYADPNGIELLLTFVREDYQASMLRALETTGWECDGLRETTQPSNRESAEIHNWDKERWVYHYERPKTEQTALV